MRIVIDMQAVQAASRYRGIGRYTLDFAKGVVRNRGSHDVFLLLSGYFPETISQIRTEFCDDLPKENIHIWFAPGPVSANCTNNMKRRELAEIVREAYLAYLRPDVIHVSSMFEGFLDDAVASIDVYDNQSVLSCSLYDFIPLQYAEHYLDSNPTYKQFYFRQLGFLRKADVLLGISDFVCDEARDIIGRTEIDVFNVSAGVNVGFASGFESDDDSVVLDRLGVGRQYLLYVGGSDFRKNLPALIKAFAFLPIEIRRIYKLVLAGAIASEHATLFRSVARQLGLTSDDVIIIGHVTDEELVCLYRNCHLYIFPSMSEGFGLPILEAMACGAPVIGSNASCFPEVIGLEEALFDPESMESFVDVMVRAINDDCFRKRLYENGVRQLGKFSWDRTALRAISAWEFACNNRENKLSEVHVDQQLQRFLGVADEKFCNLSDIDLIILADCLSKNYRPNSERRLLVDVSELVQVDSKTGIQRVVRSILAEWMSNPLEGYRVVPIYSTPGKQGYRYANKFSARFLGKDQDYLEDDIVECWCGDVLLGLDLNHASPIEQMNVLQEWRDRGVYVWYVVFDLLPIKFPDFFAAGVEKAHSEWLKAISQYDGVVCISRAVAEEFRMWSSENSINLSRNFRIKSFHLGADLKASMPTSGFPAGWSFIETAIAAKPSFLMVGTIEPRKGYEQVIDAFEVIWGKGFDVNLVIFGKEGWRVELLASRLRGHPKLGENLFWLEGGSDECLDRAYAGSECLIAASYGEGFGLPLIEAAQHQLPILARDIPVFREVAGEYAEYFNADTPEQLAQAIQTWLLKYEQGTIRSSENIPWLTWEQSAQQLLSKILPSNKMTL